MTISLDKRFYVSISLDEIFYASISLDKRFYETISLDKRFHVAISLDKRFYVAISSDKRFYATVSLDKIYYVTIFWIKEQSVINWETRQTGLPVILRNNIPGLPHICQHQKLLYTKIVSMMPEPFAPFCLLFYVIRIVYIQKIVCAQHTLGSKLFFGQLEKSWKTTG